MKFLMVNRVNRWFLTLAMLLLSFVVSAQSFPEPQNPPRLVNDFANIFSAAQSAALEQKLVAFDDTTSTQIAVVSVESLDGMAVAQYATELAHKWQIGRKGKDNGVLILVKPKTLTSKGEVYIAVGYGLEGVIPDAVASRIVRNVMLPYFQQNMMFEGVDAAADMVMGLSAGEYSAEEVMGGGISDSSVTLITVLFIIFFSIISSIARRKSGASQTYTQHSTTSHVPPIFIFGSPFGGSRHSSGGFGGGDFGGFGGFGGGGFGGGGAGGSW